MGTFVTIRIDIVCGLLNYFGFIAIVFKTDVEHKFCTHMKLKYLTKYFFVVIKL